jgi:hypothetical protein
VLLRHVVVAEWIDERVLAEQKKLEESSVMYEDLFEESISIGKQKSSREGGKPSRSPVSAEWRQTSQRWYLSRSSVKDRKEGSLSVEIELFGGESVRCRVDLGED